MHAPDGVPDHAMNGMDPRTRAVVLMYTFSVSLAFSLSAFVPVMLFLHWLF